MKDPYSVLKKPLVTEKGTEMAEENKYLFLVSKDANKIDIKNAVEKIFKVTVTNVHTVNLPGKKKRLRYKEGMTAAKRKAIVTVKDGEKIDLIS